MKYKTFKQKLTVALAAMMILASSTASFAANFNDLSQASWAKTIIEEWSSKELVSGYPDGTFRPNNNITRAEFATLVQKAFNLESDEKAQFNDVSSDAWYYSAVGTLASLGVVGGYEDGTFRPNGQITRAEAAAIMANLKGLEAQTDIALSFYDYDSMPSWAIRHIGAVLDAGVMNGYPDNTFRASNTITRAESVATLNNVLNPAVSKDLVINQAGTFGGTELEHKVVTGNVIVNVEDVTLKNMVIEGNLILAEGIEEGDAILENVTVQGNTEVLGGGANSIYIRNSRLKNIIVAKKNNSIRIVAEGTSTFGTITAKSGVKLEEKNLVNSEGFGEVIIEEGAEGEIILEGNFSKVTVKAAGVTIRLPEGSKIAEITVNAAVKIVGQGTIEKAVVSVNGVEFEKAPTKVEAAPGTSNVTITVGGVQRPVTQPPAGGGGSGGVQRPVTQPPAGGGGSGGSSPVETVNSYDINLYYNGTVINLGEIKDKDAPITSAHIDEIFNSEVRISIFEAFNTLNTDKGIANRLMSIKSDNGTNYTNQIAKDIIAKMDAGVELKSFNRTYIEGIVDGQWEHDGDVVGSDLAFVWSVLRIAQNPLSQLEQDIKKIYPEKTLENLNKDGLKIFVAGTELDSSKVKVSQFRSAVLNEIGGKRLSELKGKSLIKIQLNDRVIDVKVN